jgi:short-subunit dehydrogenase
MESWLRYLFAGRPGWMNALMVFSGYMAIVYMPWDIFVKPVAVDEEVWFGVMFHGGAAKFTALFHWAVYAAGAYGFRNMKSWMWPWAAVYVAQVAFGMLVWNLLYGVGGFGGFVIAVASFLIFGALARALWLAQPLFEGEYRTLGERYGGWALVTGASAGLGAEFARRLARDGIACALTARREDRLTSLAKELEATYGVETRVIPADLQDPKEVDRLADAVADLDLGILVNNAGLGGAGSFGKVDLERLRAMIAVNCAAPVVLTHKLLPKLRERGRAAIIITGSVAGRIPLPLHSVYSASKAFDLFLGEALAVELADDGIDVLVLEPGPTATEFQEVAGEISHGGASPADVVDDAFEALGRQPAIISGWKNWFRGFAAPRLLPRPLMARIARDVVAQQTPDDMR